MKFLAFFLLIGLASASLDDLLDDESDEFIHVFIEGLEQASSLKEYFGEPSDFLADEADEDIRTELGKVLKDGLDKVLHKIKEAVDEGKEVKDEFIAKLKELRNRMKELKLELGDKSKELLKQIKDRAKDYLRNLLEKMKFQKRASEDRLQEAELNFRDILKKIKEHIKNTIDPELLKEKIEKIFGQGSELLQQFLKTLKEKGKKKLMILIDRLLDDDDDEDDKEKRSIKDYWEKVKNYFKDLKIDLQEKYMKFGEWVKKVYDKGMEHSKDKMENIKAIAKEFGKHVKNVSKEVAEEAKEFFRQYKDELGIVWDQLKENFEEIRNRKD